MCDRYLDDLLREHLEAVPADFSAGTTFLVPESVLEDACSRNRLEGVSWRTRVEPFRINVYLEGGSGEERTKFLQRLRSDLGNELVRSGETDLAAELLEEAAGRKKMFAAAESCTGGMLGERLTAVPGSSRAFWGSAVVYADEAKRSLLGVSSAALQREGAVSAAVAEEMVRGVLERFGADVAVAVTGIAGPGGGSEEKPVGTVWIAAGSSRARPLAYRFRFGSRRELVRRRSAVAAMLMLELEIKGELSVDRLNNWHYS